MELRHMTETPEPFTVVEVAARLRVHRNTILRHLDKGDFPGAWRMPLDTGRGAWKIPQAAIDAFIARGTPTPQ